MSNVRRELVRLMPYNPEWATTGALVKREITSVLGPVAIEIAHIGSTAVPGMKARPIIDIAVAVRSFDKIPQYYDELLLLGYNHKGDTDSENQIFLSAQKNHFNIYIHIVIHGKTLWNSYVSFCDCLKRDKETREKYEQLKVSLANRHAFDRRAYSMGKGEFVRRTLRTKCDIKERSCGAVVWRKRGGRRHYLIIQNRSGHNGFPKGHMELGESERKTAVREVWEETSVRAEIVGDFRRETSYPIGRGKRKCVIYFIARFEDQEPCHNEGFETNDLLLLPFAEAHKALTHKDAKTVLEEANAIITK